MTDTTKKAMTLEDVRDWMRRLEKQHDLIPPLREAYGSAADAIDAHLSVQRDGEIVVTKDDAGQIVAVTRQDEEGRILSVVAESAQREGEAVLSLRGVDEYGPMLDWYKPWTDYKTGTKFYTAPPTPSVGVTEKLVKAIADKVCRYNNSRYQPWSDSNSPHYGDAEYFVRRVLESANITLPTVSDEMIDAALTAYEEFTGQEADYEGIQKALEAVLSEKEHG